jgi:hypothetical protein
VSADAAVLRDLARTRRNRRLADVDVFEKLYQAYLTVIAVGVVIAVGASIVGDVAVSAHTARHVADDAPAIAGLVAALVLVIGLRSGARGGPLTLEAPFVAHVLLSPLPRDLTLREPAIRQLRQSAVLGAGGGALAGLLGAQRLPFQHLPVVLWAAAAGALLGVAASGAAMIVAGWPVPKPIVHGVCLALVAGSVADVALGTAWSPGSFFGRLATSGLDFDALGLACVPVTAGLVVGGIALVGGTSIEAARRRAGLVSQLRLAVTRQDLRTVVLLQRRLAQDTPRRRPWFRVPAGATFPVFRRDLRSLARLPIVRVLRMLGLCSVAVAAGVAVWHGTSPMVLVMGLALWAAALDAIEPLAQELDHPDRWAGYPLPPGDLLTRHLVGPGIGLAVVACIPIGVLAAVTDPGPVLQTGGALLLPACAAAVLGAAASVATAPFDPSSMQTLMPETVGMQLIFRMAIPPAIAIVACLPVLAAKNAAANGLSEFAAATQYFLPICVMLGLVTIWLSRRKPAML